MSPTSCIADAGHSRKNGQHEGLVEGNRILRQKPNVEQKRDQHFW